MRSRIFRWVTIVFAILCAIGAYENVLSDDAAVRTLARTTVNQAAGCGDACKLSDMRGERGIFGETIEYNVLDHGHWNVTCRRAAIFVGDYACKAEK